MFTDKKHLFFDLDHTIWDFDKNAEETLQELYKKYKFQQLFNSSSPDRFIEAYTLNNHRLWNLYHHGQIDKTTLRHLRFADTFSQLGVDPNLFPTAFENDYLEICPTKTNLFPHAHETLTYLKGKYQMHLISNGFKEACEKKLAHSNLYQYFENIVISELIGINKPDPRIFQHALQLGIAHKDQSLMIGDNIDADVRGAINAGIDAIYFNPNQVEKPADIHYMIKDLAELQEIL
ncbi:YjjG family noncanonical pyrimidine nucleotidase [Sphingobacterium sp. HJSM2_6]|uniref:YjjG family noncanonical pyrimidine nucleotidase n=1 Tax=Sphingobacterium sp. HJSM2_6 TaxID=3366264 RepID=UPI003BE91C71